MPMNIRVNETEHLLDDGATLFSARAAFCPDADILIHNGAVADADVPLRGGDAVVLIRRGRTPTQREFESLLSARHTPGVYEKMKQACVGVAGLGGLGSTAACALARAGVGRLILCDFDVVEPSNLNRQQYFADQIGLPKTEALATTIRRINPYLGLELHNVRLSRDNVAEVFGQAGILVEALDRADGKAMLLEAWAARYPERPAVCGSGMAGAHSANTIRTKRKFGNIYVVGDETEEARPGQGLMAPRVGVAAHHQANAVMRLILGLAPDAIA